MERIQTLVGAQAYAGAPVLPEELRAIYDGELCFPSAPAGRPYVIANFVSTLDGVVTLNMPGQSEGKQVSGSNEADQFVMGLLRASCDAIVVGATTLRLQDMT